MSVPDLPEVICDPPSVAFEGHESRECGEHRTVGPHRAWCFECSEWCYPDAEMGCKGCRLGQYASAGDRVPVTLAGGSMSTAVEPLIRFSDLILLVHCPFCGALANARCRTSDGYVAVQEHSARVRLASRALRQLIEDFCYVRR
jgi:hypothetical protein